MREQSIGGTVVRVRGIDDDSDAGGNRILIRNSEGKVETYYMHLNEKPNLKEGDVVEEGDVIGYIGGSGKGKSDNYTAHLHYEMHRQNEDGEWVPISPVDADGNLIDPQNFIPDNSANTSTGNSPSPQRRPAAATPSGSSGNSGGFWSTVGSYVQGYLHGAFDFLIGD